MQCVCLNSLMLILSAGEDPHRLSLAVVRVAAAVVPAHRDNNGIIFFFKLFCVCDTRQQPQGVNLLTMSR